MAELPIHCELSIIFLDRIAFPLPPVPRGLPVPPQHLQHSPHSINSGQEYASVYSNCFQVCHNHQEIFHYLLLPCCCLSVMSPAAAAEIHPHHPSRPVDHH